MWDRTCRGRPCAGNYRQWEQHSWKPRPEGRVGMCTHVYTLLVASAESEVSSFVIEIWGPSIQGS